jgi:hypothetical protein
LAEKIDAAPPVEVKQENLIVPGKRVGLITPGMSADEIRKVYGAKNLVMAQIPIPEGAFLDGATLFAGTDRELQLIWKDGDPKKILSDVNVVGTAWIFENGIHVGSTLLEVEKINGKPFMMSGFDWDYGGYAVDFQGGKLKNLSLRFTYGERQIDPSLSGDKTISSSNPKLRTLNPTVEKSITVHMNAP